MGLPALDSVDGTTPWFIETSFEWIPSCQVGRARAYSPIGHSIAK
jgi:hypothetical protein